MATYKVVRSAAVVNAIMEEIGSKICRIESMKKDGTYTVRAGRFGVKTPKHAKPPVGTGANAKTILYKQNCIPFFDMNAKVNNGKGDYRKFCIPNLLSIRCGNDTYIF
jgi:hypothetical protein